MSQNLFSDSLSENRIVREDGHDHPSSRYRAMVFSATLEERLEIESQVNSTLSNTFGDTPSMAAEGYIVGGLGWITSNDMPYDKRSPQEHPAWVARIEKARREIAEHKDHIQCREQCEAVHRAWPSESVSGLIDFIKRQYV